jgi:hypothetical protein
MLTWQVRFNSFALLACRCGPARSAIEKGFSYSLTVIDTPSKFFVIPSAVTIRTLL